MGALDTITNLMYLNSTLVTAIIIVAALAYLGTNTINPEHVHLRRAVGYVTATLLVLIGVLGVYFGGLKIATLIYAHVYTFDAFRLEWLGVGAAAILAGFLILYQSITRY